jgi:hypothetical protein
MPITAVLMPLHGRRSTAMSAMAFVVVAVVCAGLIQAFTSTTRAMYVTRTRTYTRVMHTNYNVFFSYHVAAVESQYLLPQLCWCRPLRRPLGFTHTHQHYKAHINPGTRYHLEIYRRFKQRRRRPDRSRLSRIHSHHRDRNESRSQRRRRQAKQGSQLMHRARW